MMADMSLVDGSKELSSTEIDMLLEVANLESREALKFWATVAVIQVLSDWGVWVSKWLHGCMCYHHTTEKETKQCHLKGRRAVQLALGAWKTFCSDLKALNLTQPALSAIHKLEGHSTPEDDYAKFLIDSFQQCKASMELRAVQAWSWWGSLPFSVLEMCEHLVDPNVSETKSRNRADELLRQYDSSDTKTSLGVVSWMFFGNEVNRKYIRKWIQGKPLHETVLHLLLGYATSLVVMQRLEGRHHLINIYMSHGRAQKPSAVIAGLRRRLNGDIVHPEFKSLLPELLNSFENLVPQKWGSRAELLQIVYGYGLDQLHPNLHFEEEQMARHAVLTDHLHQSTAPPSKMVLCFDFRLSFFSQQMTERTTTNTGEIHFYRQTESFNFCFVFFSY